MNRSTVIAWTLAAAGALAVVALAGFSVAFAERLEDGFGVTYEPVGVTVDEDGNATFSVLASKPEAAQDFTLQKSTTRLALQDGSVAGDIDARSCPEGSPPLCVRLVRFEVPVGDAGALAAGWRLEAELTWRSEDLFVTSAHDVAFDGEGTAFGG